MSQGFALSLCPRLCSSPSVNGHWFGLSSWGWIVTVIFRLHLLPKKLKLKINQTHTPYETGVERDFLWNNFTSTILLNSRLRSDLPGIWIVLGICFLRSLYFLGLVKLCFPLPEKSEAYICVSSKPHKETTCFCVPHTMSFNENQNHKNYSLFKLLWLCYWDNCLGPYAMLCSSAEAIYLATTWICQSVTKSFLYFRKR